MINGRSFKENWDKMREPPNSESITINPVSGTNAYLTKSHDGSMGLFLSDINDQIPHRKYEHLEIKKFPKKEINLPNKPKFIVRNVLFLDVDHEINSASLSLILEALHEQEPSGQFTASNLITVLDEVEEILRRPKSLPTIEEVAGAWGELYILQMLLQNTSNPHIQRKIVSAWEGETREKLDFRFVHAMQALEIKTTMSEDRVHHLHGIEQVSIPPGFDSGAVASLCVEIGGGDTCQYLVDSIFSNAIGNEEEITKFKGIFIKRLGIRGRVCFDERFLFRLSKSGLEFYDFSQVPSPAQVKGVTPIEWLSDLTDSVPLNSTETDNLISKITS
jgi:hypothetical protein